MSFLALFPLMGSSGLEAWLGWIPGTATEWGSPRWCPASVVSSVRRLEGCHHRSLRNFLEGLPAMEGGCRLLGVQAFPGTDWERGAWAGASSWLCCTMG